MTEFVRHFQSRSWLPGLILVAAILVAYQPAWQAGFIWDDDSYVTGNQTLRSLDGLERIWLKPESSPQYYPLVFTSFWAEYHLWKLHPSGYHLINILMHAMNAVLLWCVLRRLKIPGSWCAAAIFALHPVMVESVAWVTERKNVLSCLFYLLAVLVFLRFRPLNSMGTAAKSDWRYYPLVLALFICALLSKTVTCSLPAAFLLLIWWKTGRVEKRDILALVPMFALGAILGLATVWLEKYHVGARGVDWTLSFGQRCLLAGRALWFYAGKLFWPGQLTFIYPRWQMDGSAAWQYSFPLAALAVMTVLWSLRQKIGRGPLVAVLLFAGTLAPALGFIDVFPFRYSFVADHFQYLASIGLITLVACGGAMICDRAGQRGRRAGISAVSVVLLGLGMSTWRQAGIYKNAETLWTDTVAKNPNASMAYNNLGDVLVNQGRFLEAIVECRISLRIDPRNPEPYNNLGTALARAGRIPEAIKQCEQALRIKPDYAQAHNNLGNIFLQIGRSDEAMEHYNAALTITPYSANSHYNLGTALLQAGRLDEAIMQFRKVLEIQADYAEAYNNLGNALFRKGQLDEAIAQYRKVIEINPDNAEAHYNLGMVLGLEGKLDEVAEQYREAIKIKPNYADAHGNLAKLLATQGKLDEAIKEYQRTLELAPNSEQAHFRYGEALQAQHHFAAAKTEYQKVIELDPKHMPAYLSLAWLLATCPEASLRDGGRAVELAQQAGKLAGSESPQILDTLAAAYAEAGQFGKAVEMATRALNLPAAQNNQQLAEAIQIRLKLYQADFRSTKNHSGSCISDLA